MINPYPSNVTFVNTSPFGMRGGQMHFGQDFAAVGKYLGANPPIVATQSGKIIRAGWFGGYGNCVDIQHDKSTITRYAHLNSILVRLGQNVFAGQTIGTEGTTGESTGNHLHFEVIKNGVQVNPLPYLTGTQSTNNNLFLFGLLYLIFEL